MRTVLGFGLIALLASCDFLTDAATRAAFEIEAAAGIMEKGDLRSYEFTHVPKPSPDGVTGPWELLIQQSGPMGDGPTGALCIGRYGTSYHNRFVTVPRTLSVTKQAGEGCVIVLRREGGVIRIVELR